MIRHRHDFAAKERSEEAVGPTRLIDNVAVKLD